jgi:glycosyltransferase involved in cell wall biosynthesis
MSASEPQRVSTVITAYNCARYLGQAIESVLGQTSPPQQVVVVDDGSTDDCAAVARAYGDAIQYQHQPNAGSGAGRNAGARQATGDWMAFLDGDDYWEPDKLARQLEAAAADQGLDAIFGHIQNFVSPDLDAAMRAQFHTPQQLMPGYCPSAMLIKRQAVVRVGNFATSWHVSEFIDWYGRALEAGLRTYLLAERVAWRRIHAGNSTRRQRQHLSDYAQVLKAMLDRRRAASRGTD